MPASATMRRFAPVLLNLALAAGVCAGLLGALEGLARWREARHPPPARPREIIRGWQKWEGEFYHFGRRPPRWPLDGDGINGDGLRDRHHTRATPGGTTRLAILGDSVTYGLYVEARNAYPQRLQVELDRRGERLEVFNVAAPGWTTRQQRIAYARLLRPYGVRHVILAVCLNDLLELQQNLAAPPAWMAALHRRSALFRTLARAEQREVADVEALDRKPDGPVGRAAFARFSEELDALRAELARDGAGLALLLLPYEFQVLPGAPAPQLQPRLLALARERGLPAQDLLEPLRRLGGQAFVDYNHLSPAGTQAVAEALLAGPLLPPRVSYSALAAAGTTLDEPSAERRAAAAWRLSQTVPDREQARALATRLSDLDEAVRLEALRALVRAAPEELLRAPVRTALGDEREAVRLEAARVLWAWGSSPGDATLLAAVLDHDDAYLRAFAAASLTRLGAAALPAVRATLAQADAGLRRRGLRVIGHLAEQGRPPAGDVAALLGDSDAGVRRLAARTLGLIGAASARPALERCARSDADPQVRAEAVRSLKRLAR